MNDVILSIMMLSKRNWLSANDKSNMNSEKPVWHGHAAWAPGPAIGMALALAGLGVRRSGIGAT
jgi:hypothetical protein